MTEPRNAIVLDDSATLDDQSFEIARIWVNNGGRSFSWIAANVLQSPTAFGQLLSDAVRQGAQVYTTEDRDEGEAMRLVLSGLAAGLAPNGVQVILPSFEERD